MAARHLSWIAIVACLSLAGCPSSPPLAQDEIPGDFHFSYEMKVTDEEAFQRALEVKEMEEAAAARAGEEAAPEAGATDGETPPAEGETPPAEGETAPAEDGPRAGTEGLPVTYAYVVIDHPGHVKYEIHFGLGNPVKRTGSVDLSEAAYERIYHLVRDTDLFSLKKRYIGDRPTGTKVTYVVKGNLHMQVIDVKGAEEPRLEKMWESVKEILLDKDARIFDNPKERSDVFIIDRRTRCFHRGDCPKLDEVSAEFRIRKNTVEECLNDKAWPCVECRPLEAR